MGNIKETIKSQLRQIVTYLLIDWEKDKIYEEFTYVQSMADSVLDQIKLYERFAMRTKVLLEEFCAAVYISSQHMVAITQKKKELAYKMMLIMDVLDEDLIIVESASA